MRTIIATCVWLLCAPVSASAQAPASPADPMSIGGMVGPGLGNRPWLLPGARVSVPLSSRLGLDIDAGAVIGSDTEGGVQHGVQMYTRYRWFAGAQVRVMQPRSASGASRYFLLGPVLFRDAPRPAETREDLPAVRVGYGWDWLKRRGQRIALEVGVAGSEGPVVYATAVIQFRVGPGS
mgnify:CR=1 FL=1